MPLPPEIKARMHKTGDVKVSMKEKGEHAVIEGKTAVPFGTFVTLLRKRKVQSLMSKWQKEPVILSSELLTHIASAGNDTDEDRSKVILTALVIGLCFGLFVMAIGLFVLGILGITIGQRELMTGLLVLLVLAGAVYASMQIHTGKMKQDLVETVDKVSEMFGK
jgi:hypothetical protein